MKKETPTFNISYDIAKQALKNNIPEEVEKMKAKQLQNWSLCIRLSKILTLSFIVVIYCVAVYYLIIKK